MSNLQVDPKNGTFTGSEITFVYPDFKTGIQGTFHDGVLIHGVEVEINATRCMSGFREIQTQVKQNVSKNKNGAMKDCRLIARFSQETF